MLFTDFLYIIFVCVPIVIVFFQPVQVSFWVLILAGYMKDYVMLKPEKELHLVHFLDPPFNLELFPEGEYIMRP